MPDHFRNAGSLQKTDSLRSILCIGIAGAVILILTAAMPHAAEPAKTTDAELRFESHILPLVKAKCARCHGGKEPQAELTLDSSAGVLKGGDSGPAVVPGKPADSPLYERIHNGTMPPDKKDRLSESEVELVRRWIVAGARAESIAPPLASKAVDPHSPATSARVTQLDVEPILLRRCSVCHGLRKQEGNLDVRARSSLLRGGKSGPAIVLGKPAESRLLKRIHAGEMPPPQRMVEVSIKPIDTNEVELLERWIEQGAPEVAANPDVATTAPDPMVSDKDRDFWAFRSPKPVAIPQVAHRQQVRNSIDAFLLSRMERSNQALSLAPEADRLTLLRRASFDLTGLPPEPDDVKKFLADQSPDAYEKLIDRLLASPRYGERWGRYWLDAAGYADSEGKREQDLLRTQAWRYRDYVIRSLNADKPYDRFLLEQIAGDELDDYELKELTPELYDNLVATGFLRMVPDGTWASITGYVPDRLDVISDEIDVLGSTVMGLTLKCCRCHNHKFDPLPQRDYYRLTDIFKGAYDEYDWLRPDEPQEFAFLAKGPPTTRNLPLGLPSERRKTEIHNRRIDSEIHRLRTDMELLTRARATLVVDERIGNLPLALRQNLRTIASIVTVNPSEMQRALAKKFEQELRLPSRDELKKVDPKFNTQIAAIEQQIKQWERKRLPEPSIRALWDRGEPSPTYIYRRGDPMNLGKRVGPGVPSVLTDGKTPFVAQPPWPNAKKTGRRLAFARWLTRPDHPLTARVIVNRLWKHHFGTGIVKTLGNFGKAGSPPSHPELLDWLAREFVQRGWSFKQMHRLMMTSAAYRQSSEVTPELAKLDPENRFFSRMPLTRLDAEAVYDSLLVAAGKLDETPYGRPDAITVRADGLITPKESPKGWRRLIYVQQARRSIPTALEAFDYPQMNPNCLERRDSIVATQALFLRNDGLVHTLAEQFAKRVKREAGSIPQQQVDRAFLIALSRPPSSDERAVSLNALLAPIPTTTPITKVQVEEPSARLVAFCRALVNSAAFLFVD